MKCLAYLGKAGFRLYRVLGVAFQSHMHAAWSRKTHPRRYTKRTLGRLLCRASLFCFNRIMSLPCVHLHGYLLVWKTVSENPLPSSGTSLECQQAVRQEEGLSGLSMVTSLWAPDSNCGVIKLNSTI